ncbi:MAG: efflux RND transporter permease subunit [Leptospiraceae bacterium]|nr:efflux RND transporter permease subunit [Leptospiraceae bacterium]
MKNIVQFFIERKMVLDIFLAALFLFGYFSIVNSKKEGFPEIPLNKIFVQTIVPGGSAKDIEINVTSKIEDQIKEVEGIKEIISYSEEGVSKIEIQGLEKLKPSQFQKLFSDIENAISKIDDFPTNIKGKPSIWEVKSSDMPVMEIAYTGEYKNLKPYLEDLKERLRVLKGVSKIDIIGLGDEEILIKVDPVKARNNFLDLRAIANSLKMRNQEGSAGIIYSNEGEKKVTLEGKYKTTTELLNTELVTNELGNSIKLRDVAQIEFTPEDKKLIVRNNGKPGALLAIRKLGSEDLLKTVDRVNEVLKKEILPDGVESLVLLDQSTLTRDRINLLVGNSIMGFILVVLVLFYFLNFQTAFWTAFGIPFSLLGMLIFLKVMDISINLISLAGFIIIIGMLVDDAVVIAEKYNTNLESGMGKIDSAVNAVQRMWAPVVASALTTMVAFAPLFLVGGFPGAFIWTIPLMVIVGLSVSLSESFFILPSHLLHSNIKKVQQKKIMEVLENLYKKSLIWALLNKFKFLFTATVLLFLSLFLLKNYVKKDPFPQDAAEGFFVNLTFPLGYTSIQTESNLQKIENFLLNMPKEEILGLSSRIGVQTESSTIDRGIQNNLATIFVYLTPYQNRKRTANEIMENLRSEIKKLNAKDSFQYSLNLKRIGPPMGKDIEIRVISNNDSLREKKVKSIEEFLKNSKGVNNIDTNSIRGLDEYVLKLNYLVLSVVGLTAEDVLNSIRIAINGIVVTDMSRTDDTVNLRVLLDDKIHFNDLKKNDQDSIQAKNLLPIKNKQGNLINLDRMINIQEKTSLASVKHINSIRAEILTAGVDQEIISPVELMDLVRKNFPDEKNLQIQFSGQPLETNLIFSGLTTAAIFAILGIYLIIALIFQSYTRPIVVMLSLPFMAIGLAFVLVTHNIPGSMMVGGSSLPSRDASRQSSKGRKTSASTRWPR